MEHGAWVISHLLFLSPPSFLLPIIFLLFFSPSSSSLLLLFPSPRSSSPSFPLLSLFPPPLPLPSSSSSSFLPSSSLLPSSSPFFLPSRTQLQKFFFPNDYVEHPVTEHPQPGEKRIYTNFDVSVQVSSPATFNVLFRDKEVCGCMGVRRRVGEEDGKERGGGGR